MVDIEKIKKQVAEVISYSQDISNPKVDKLINSWYKAKKDFIELFDGKLIYATPDKITIDLSQEQKDKKVEEFCELLTSKYDYDDLVYFIESNKDCFFKNILARDFNFKDYHIKAGIKISKAFRKFVNNPDDLYSIQTAASMILQEDKISGYLCLSVHPLDYLSSSENNYNWRSCHALDGEYRSGNLSYMLDTTTIVCYICGDEQEKLPRFPYSVPWNSKKWRMLLFVSTEKNALFAGRHYPFFSKAIMEEVKTRFVNKLIVSEKLKSFYTLYSCFSSTWSEWHDDKISSFEFKNSTEETSFYTVYIPMRDKIKPIKDYVTDVSYLHFNDLLESSVYTPYYCWDKISRSNIYFPIGAHVPCLCCEENEIAESGLMVCDDCASKIGFSVCADCGSIVRESNMIWVNSDTGYVCEDCFENNYFTCEACLENFHNDYLRYSEDRDACYCLDCYDEMIAYKRITR